MFFNEMFENKTALSCTRVWAEAFRTVIVVAFDLVFVSVDKVVTSVLKGHPGPCVCRAV